MPWAVIDWKANPIAFSLGPVEVRWYGLCFLAIILTAIKLLEPRFRRLRRDPDDATSLVIHVVIGLVIGSRLVHCLFYDPGQFLAAPWRILFIWQGGLASHGAGIGAMLGTWVWVRGDVYYASKWLGTKVSEPWRRLGVNLFGAPQHTPGLTFRMLADTVIPAMTLSICYIRLGNLFNSEIVGRVTDVPWAFRFWLRPEVTTATGAAPQVYAPATTNFGMLALILGATAALTWFGFHARKTPEQRATDGWPWQHFFWIFFSLRIIYELIRTDHPPLPENYTVLPRHPSQIYEALLGIPLFLLLAWLAWREDAWQRHRPGFYLLTFLALYFSLRFGAEFFKDYQSEYAASVKEATDAPPLLTMGQWLSMPFVLISAPLLAWHWKPDPDLGENPGMAPEPAAEAA